MLVELPVQLQGDTYQGHQVIPEQTQHCGEGVGGIPFGQEINW